MLNIYNYVVMELTLIFNFNANLSLIFNLKNQVFINDAIHNATIEINEKGSVARTTRFNLS